MDDEPLFEGTKAGSLHVNVKRLEKVTGQLRADLIEMRMDLKHIDLYLTEQMRAKQRDQVREEEKKDRDRHRARRRRSQRRWLVSILLIAIAAGGLTMLALKLYGDPLWLDEESETDMGRR